MVQRYEKFNTPSLTFNNFNKKYRLKNCFSKILFTFAPVLMYKDIL